jgi:phosphatidylserine/phosphatidylglycerophosphate/cardiolipin synthase-like enzyme
MTNIAIPFVPSASYPMRPGNSVRPLIDGEPAFRRICQAVEAARQSVWVSVTFMWAAFEMPDGRGAHSMFLIVLPLAASMCDLSFGVRTRRPSGSG